MYFKYLYKTQRNLLYVLSSVGNTHTSKKIYKIEFTGQSLDINIFRPKNLF